MDCADNGTEHQFSSSPANKTRPPPVARKPRKPFPLKKPVPAAKPTHLIASLLPTNGESSSCTSPPPLPKPAQPQANERPQERGSPKGTTCQPSQPPPPLPKSPPKGHSSKSVTPPQIGIPPSVPCTAQPLPGLAQPLPGLTEPIPSLAQPQTSIAPPLPNNNDAKGVMTPLQTRSPPLSHKTSLPERKAPPLPKTPPHGGSQKVRKSSVPVIPVDSENKSSSPDFTVASSMPINQKHASSVPNTPSTDVTTCDINSNRKDKDLVTSAGGVDDQNNSEQDEFVFTNLKSKFSDSSEQIVPKPLTKAPLKPKQRLIDNTVLSNKNENEEKQHVDMPKPILNEMKSEKKGNSSWFVASEDETPGTEKARKTLEEFKDESCNTAVQIQMENEIKETTYKVGFRRINSPAHSPKIPGRPPPRTPNKPKTFGLDDKEVNPPVTNTQSSSHQGDAQLNSEQTGETFQDKEDKESSAADVSVKDPKPVPRRPIPRPRPAPRRSLNRLSGTDETLSSSRLTGSVHNLSQDTDKNLATNLTNIKAKSEDSVFLVSQVLSLATGEISIDHNSEGESRESNHKVRLDQSKPNQKSHNKSEGGRKITSIVKSRVVFSEKGEQKQYRVIDKSIVKSHVTDSGDSDGDSVVLRKKDREKSDSTEIPAIPSKTNGEAENGNKVSINQRVQKNISDVRISDADSIKQNCKSDESDGEQSYTFNEKLKDDFDDLLSDKSILEPSSLLNEIEEILSRSYKHSSLTRSGSSPEKSLSPLSKAKTISRCERSRSVDINSEYTPVRPPRPKKEQKRLRSRSQVIYDSCGSDTESLPDLSRMREDVKSDLSLTLPPAKPHPPKPKRNKLLKVQRSQSDVSAMKAVIDKHDAQSKSPAVSHKRQMSDAGPFPGVKNDSEGNSPNPARPSSWRNSRPSRKAPPPPPVPPFKVTPPSPGVDMQAGLSLPDSSNKQKHAKGKAKLKHQSAVKDTCGSVYSSINDEEVMNSSDEDHDYHYISDNADNYDTVINHKTTGMVKVTQERSGKSCSPPKLPPRNLNNSHSFETSSLSSASHDFDSAITGAASSVDDLSVSSSCTDQDNDLTSPGMRGLKTYPKTSSPNVKLRLPGNGEDQGSGKGSRPVSEASFQSEEGSGDQHLNETPLSSSESDLDDEEKAERRRDKKLLMIAKEIMSSERVFVDVLHLLNIDFRRHISEATEAHGRPVIPNEILNRILDFLPQLQNFNEDLLKDLEHRVDNWEQKKCIADIFVKKGPFLKLYSSYIRDFETMTSTLDEAVRKYSAFQAALKDFEMSPRCAQLALKHYMLKPIQRIPQYRLLLQDYIKNMPEDSPEAKDMQTALAIVSEVAHHANENMRHGDYVQKMLEIQRSLIGQFEVIKPGRIFLKEGELMKLSRKEMQPRYFFMFNDVLLYTTPVATGYKLNNVLPLAGMKVSVPAQDDFKMEFSIISVQRSFTLHAATIEEREDWVTALNAAIDENAQKRNTFEAVRAGAQVLLDKDFVLGHKAPLWIPDARVTMCMLCTCEFTVTWRRHHCRACGRVVCGNCSDNKWQLRYLKYKNARVCDECFKTLTKEKEKSSKGTDGEKGDKPAPAKNNSSKDSGEGMLSSFFDRFNLKNKSGRSDKKNTVGRPDRLVIKANDEGASMSGYLTRQQKNKKWKKDWYLIKDKVLYTFKATQNTAADESMVLLGYEVYRFQEYYEGIEPDLLFQLSHPNTEPIVFRTDSATATDKWVTVMRESSVA